MSVLRKILTISIFDRIWNRLKQKIPSKQAAYQPGRGTTEQVHAIKLLAEKAIISNDYNIYLTLLDMSKAFDTVDPKILFEPLEEILNADELFIVHSLAVKIGSLTGISFLTTIGIMQGACLCAILFVLYLAMCHRLPIKTKMKGFLVDPMYADDITIAGTNKVQVQQIEEKMTIKLNNYNLLVNKDKTEKYQIPRPPPPPPPTPTIKELTENKNNQIIWSELD